MNQARARQLWQESLATWAVPEPLTLSEWMDEHFYLSPESSGESGKWDTLPYQREIADAISDPYIPKVTWMKSARIGYTKLICGAIGYFAEHEPRSSLVLQPTDGDAKGFSKEEIGPMLRDVPVLRRTFREVKRTDVGSSTTLKKTFRGGILHIAGAHTPRSFRRITVDNVFFDEVDGYELSAGEEGDPLKLGEKRSMASAFSKHVYGSTPTTETTSRIEPLYESSDKRKYFVPCPHCRTMQVLVWAQVRWPENDPGRAHYQCSECQGEITDKRKMWMLERGEWRAAKPFTGNAGFHLWAGYSVLPQASFPVLAKEFLDSKSNALKLKVFTNTVLAETWKEKGKRSEPETLQKRAAPYPADVPAGGLVCVAGVDVQENRIEVGVDAYGFGEESWAVETKVFYGDPTQQDVWNDLDQYLISRKFSHESGNELGIAATCVDSGYLTDHVYAYCATKFNRRVYAVKGMPGEGRPIAPLPRLSKSKGVQCKVFMAGVDTVKGIMLSRFLQTEPGPGFCNFHDGCSEEYFAQLTAEELRERKRKGFTVREFVKIRPRNEAFDLRVYGYVALTILKPDFNAIADLLNNQPDETPDPEPEPNKRRPVVRRFNPRGGNFATNWKR